MAEKHTLICDGCGTEDEQPKSKWSYAKPKGWITTYMHQGPSQAEDADIDDDSDMNWCGWKCLAQYAGEQS